MKRKIDIVAAIRNRNLFGSLPRVKKLGSWTNWIVVLKAIFDLEMTADEPLIFNHHTGRVSPPVGGSKETYLIIGRRGGKSFISALVTAYIACFVDFSPYQPSRNSSSR